MGVLVFVQARPDSLHRRFLPLNCPPLLPPPTAEEDLPRIKHIETSSLHRGVAGARHTFLPLPPMANKLDTLLQASVLSFLSLALRECGCRDGRRRRQPSFILPLLTT